MEPDGGEEPGDISIPFSTIKSPIMAAVRLAVRLFQFHLVRLKVM